MRLPLHAALALSAAALVACSFDAAQSDDALELNVCGDDGDCGDTAECVDGMCVAMGVAEPLTVMLTVTPRRAPDGSGSLPIVLERFVVDGPHELDLTLPFPIEVRGQVRNAGAPIEAEVSFEPLTSVPGQPVSAVTMSTAGRDKSDAQESDYTVRLLEGAEYRMVVTPTDPSLPPFNRTVQAVAGAMVSVDYAELAMRKQTFAFDGTPVDRTLKVRAFDSATGKAISSAAVIEEGEATVLFSPGWAPYRLEVTAEEVYDADAAEVLDDCARSSGTFPVMRVDSDQLEDAEADRIELALPPPPVMIRFEGTVELCTDAAETVELLPMTLRARSILLPAEEASGATFMGMFSATASAEYSSRSQRYSFCVEVFPGEYDVVVTPPPSTGCALFAETRLVKAPGAGESSSGTLLQLPPAAHLTATLQTMDLSPLAGAGVDAIALGRRDNIILEENDVSVTSYNRSGQAVTDDEGMFTLPVDLGSYDVVIKPPPSSGFAWQIRHDVDIGRRGASFATVIDMTSPVAVRGALGYGKVAMSTLEGAEIRAFAIVERGPGDERGIAIGKAEAKADGSFVLLLPPSIRMGW